MYVCCPLVYVCYLCFFPAPDDFAMLVVIVIIATGVREKKYSST